MAVIPKILISKTYLLNKMFLFTQQKIYCLTYNKVEMLKVSSIK